MMRPAIVGLSGLLAPAARRLDRALGDPQRVQSLLQKQLCWRMAATAYGRDHGLNENASSFTKLPVVGWKEVAPYVQRQLKGERDALVPGGVIAVERTSGSGGTQKDVLYNRDLLGTFRRMFSAWAYDVIKYGPRLRTGCFYFSISPPRLTSSKLTAAEEGDDEHKSRAREARAREARAQEASVPSLRDDADYLSGWQRLLLGPFFVRPRGLAPEMPAEEFLDQTCLALLAAPRLEIVSVWNPSFLLVLFAHLENHGARLVEILAGLGKRGKRARAKKAGAILARPLVPQELWPELKFVSCWTDGFAQHPAARLQERLGAITIQGKGLLATECPVTIPRLALDEQGFGQVPLLADILLELETEDGNLIPLAAADEGRRYQIIVSQSAGLLRYRLGDLVEVRGRLAKTPLLRFVSRADAVSDLVGEKLSEQHVETALRSLLHGEHAVLVPQLGPPARYHLLVTNAAVKLSGAKEELASRLDEALLESHHYRLARRLGQLEAPMIVTVEDVQTHLQAAWQRSGRNLGDLKPTPLLRVPLSL